MPAVFSVEMLSVNSGRNASTICISKIKTSNWIKEIKDWMMTGSECKTPTAISYMKNYWNNRFFIEDDLLWVRIKIRGEPARVYLVLSSHKIKEVLETVMEPCLQVMKEWTKQKPDYNKTIGGQIWIRPFHTSSRPVTNIRKQNGYSYKTRFVDPAANLH